MIRDVSHESRISDPVFFILDPGVKKARSRIRIRNTAGTKYKNPYNFLSCQCRIGLNVPTPAYNNTGSISPDEKPLSRLVFTKYALYLPP
jgi:hypothetical protein